MLSIPVFGSTGPEVRGVGSRQHAAGQDSGLEANLRQYAHCIVRSSSGPAIDEHLAVARHPGRLAGDRDPQPLPVGRRSFILETALEG
jgi:hypothetical protein